MPRWMCWAAAAALLATPARAWTPPKRPPEVKASACPEVGPGYVRVPGTDTCVKVGGLLRVEALRVGGSR